ncbi:sigma-70 family RNA polymerase sigma factor [Sphingobacterium daejeonense]|nr:sigma-70 family RNA polymerase sigma factor [Sphingobacterium daejeonense]MCT1530941.1 sigma-70 family RNA polymerase sigma factor [Sphingobacterium daejeonense]
MLNIQNVSDEELLSDVLQNQRLAFNELYERYKSAMLIYASRRIKAEHAEDIVHDVFLKIWNNRHQLRMDERFASYLFKALRSRIIDFMARDKNAKKYLESIESYSYYISSDKTDEKIRSENFMEKIYQLLERYGPKYQIILTMRMEGYSNQEIADELGITEKTVRNQSWTLMKILRSKLLCIFIYLIF